MADDPPLPTPDLLAAHIHFIRGEKVILSHDLAVLYDVTVSALNQAVKRNLARFPTDFMFQLTSNELRHLKSQTVISNRGGSRTLPYAFTEQGVAMLSSVLRSERAIQVNIAIIRTFVQLRRLMDGNLALAQRIKELELKYDEQFEIVFDAIKALIKEEADRNAKPKGSIGFHK